MRKTYTDLLNQHFRNIGKAGQTSDPTLLADFQYSLGERYQTIMGTLSSYINTDTQTASTVASQQSYSYPVGTVGVDSATVTIGTLVQPLTPIYSQTLWNEINSWPVTSAYARFIFPRKDDFGIWPVPSGVNTITFNRYFRDRNLLVDDYTTGTITATAGSTTITGSGTTFTSAMVGRWFTVTDTSARGQGYWYRVGTYTSATSIALETGWAGSTAAALTYRIGETPEIPEEGHAILAYGTAADYYMGLRAAPEKALPFDNMFWTGSFNNSSRVMDDPNISGGLIGIVRKYEDRERSNIVQRNPRRRIGADRIFAESIS